MLKPIDTFNPSHRMSLVRAGNGAYVKTSDYRTLKAENQRLRKALGVVAKDTFDWGGGDIQPTELAELAIEALSDHKATDAESS